jgi:hypothetical protein
MVRYCPDRHCPTRHRTLIIRYPKFCTEPMHLRILTLTLDSDRPRLDTVDKLRPWLSGKFSEFATLNKDKAASFTHRYPVAQCKIVKNQIMILGINEGADFIRQLVGDERELRLGEITCTVMEHDREIREEEFGVTAEPCTYELVTPWLALNEQNARKFYDLSGKPERDAFMNANLARTHATLAKSLGYEPPAPVACDHKLRFRKDRINGTNEMVFEGKFRANLRIPDYLAIGQSVSQGFGTVRMVAGPAGEPPAMGP